MKTPSQSSPLPFPKGLFSRFFRRPLALALTCGASLALGAAEIGQTFDTPEAAVSALATAAGTQDANALRLIFGPRTAEIENPDRVQATNDLRAFAAAFGQTNRIVRESDSNCVLEVGRDFWPFPVPLANRDGRWFFDTAAGKDELLNRRIGRNELATLESVRAYVQAQREYAMKDRDGDDVLEFAQKFGSAPGQKDGLYWPPELDGEMSPLGPLAAQAHAEGYHQLRQGGASREPFHGYFFKVLIRQAKSAPGGKYDYRINGNMIGGFALVAWPAEYGESGIMTFIVNQQGRVYQKDLGPATAKLSAAMTTYDPDHTWTASRE
ncbi:MAG TPA: DUF2950 domain-containing protein [Verrucomicrobiota bacterium]|nr:DUF2950 domain-containing protein [Verrucomicrobiota bacterium]HRZ37297.1 DUF2950 domain-containing protein [Candidatus Paceibacterota bacterium]HRZ55042.1 DUF2950 domain-containing protein [Candidatus Paceibacterota bacterium]